MKKGISFLLAVFLLYGCIVYAEAPSASYKGIVSGELKNAFSSMEALLLEIEKILETSPGLESNSKKELIIMSAKAKREALALRNGLAKENKDMAQQLNSALEMLNFSIVMFESAENIKSQTKSSVKILTELKKAEAAIAARKLAQADGIGSDTFRILSEGEEFERIKARLVARKRIHSGHHGVHHYNGLPCEVDKSYFRVLFNGKVYETYVGSEKPILVAGGEDTAGAIVGSYFYSFYNGKFSHDHNSTEMNNHMLVAGTNVVAAIIGNYMIVSLENKFFSEYCSSSSSDCELAAHRQMVMALRGSYCYAFDYIRKKFITRRLGSSDKLGKLHFHEDKGILMGDHLEELATFNFASGKFE